MTGPWQEISELIDTLDAASDERVPTLARGLACAARTSLARRLGCAQAGPVADGGGSHLASEAMAAYGESLAIPERVVVAPAIGRFYPAQLGGRGPGTGARIRCGQAIGQVNSQRVSTPVCSPFEGHLMGMLAEVGEHVVPGQPVAWLRVGGAASTG
jgi:biotin carboxyl carrier protein